jgi:hypothetical protein
MITDEYSLKLFERALLDLHDYPKPDIDTETFPEHIIIAYLDFGERPCLRIYTPDVLVKWWDAAKKYATEHRQECEDFSDDRNQIIIHCLTEVHINWEIGQATW